MHTEFSWGNQRTRDCLEMLEVTYESYDESRGNMVGGYLWFSNDNVIIT
jgi:hypothetical protein